MEIEHLLLPRCETVHRTREDVLGEEPLLRALHRTVCGTPAPQFLPVRLLLRRTGTRSSPQLTTELRDERMVDARLDKARKRYALLRVVVVQRLKKGERSDVLRLCRECRPAQIRRIRLCDDQPAVARRHLCHCTRLTAHGAHDDSVLLRFRQGHVPLFSIECHLIFLLQTFVLLSGVYQLDGCAAKALSV